jgi:hypothetical protein
LYKLTNLDASFMGSVVLPQLLEKALDPKSLNVRQGAVLGVAETILGLMEANKLQEVVSDKTVADLVALVPIIEKRRLYRGRGGELMRSAVCRLVECISRAQISMTIQDQVKLLDAVDACISHPAEPIQSSACFALEWLMGTYFPVKENGPTPRLQSRVVDKFLKMIDTSDNPAVTRGYALALGHLPAKLLAPSIQVMDSILACLQKAARFDSLVGSEGDAETRRNALLSLAMIVDRVGVGPNPQSLGYPVVGLEEGQVSRICDTYLLALEDYRSDRRGDVGSWSRMVGMEGAVSLLIRAASIPDRVYCDSQTTTRIVGALLKQLSEKLDTVRSCAGNCLAKLLLSERPSVPGIAFQSELIQAFGLTNPEPLKWKIPSFTFPKVVSLASLPGDEYFRNIIEGVSISIGGLTESITSSASTAMVDWAKREKQTGNINRLGMCLLSLLADNRGTARVVLPVLKTLSLLFSRQCLDGLVVQSNDFTESCMQRLVDTAKGCNDIHRLLASINVTVDLLGSLPSSQGKDHEVRSEALSFLWSMLSHRFPRVRSQAAEQLYVVLLDDDPQSSVMDVVLHTPWSSDGLKDAKELALDIATRLGLDT